MKKSYCASIALVCFILLASAAISLPYFSNSSVKAQTETGISSLEDNSSDPVAASQLGIGLGGGPVIMNINALESMTGGSTSVGAISLAVQKYMVPLNVQFVFMDPGWSATSANTSSEYILGGFQQWIANWLSATQPFGIKTAFFFLQWGYLNTGWTVSFLGEYPGDKTVNGSGDYIAPAGSTDITLSAFSIGDNRDLYAQLKEDINQLYNWYGSYGDWVGFGEGATGDRNYYGPTDNEIQASRPWDNGTLNVFANSVFFQRTINSTGYYIGTNTLSKIWAEFLDDRPDISFSTGTPGLTSYPIVSVYGGKGTGGNVQLQRFYVPPGQTLVGFQLLAYVSKTGSPPNPLYETIYPDNSSNLNGRPVLDDPLANLSVSGVNSTNQWISTTFSTTRLAGSNYYWVGFTTPGGDSSDYYNVYDVGSAVQPDIYVFTSSSGYSSIQRNPSSSVLWIKNLAGSQNVTIYPLLNGGALLGMSQNTFYFETQIQTKINMISFFTSDRGYDPNNTTLTVEYPNGTSLATATVSTALMSGGQGLDYFPFQLSSTITIYPGIKYQIVFSALATNDNYAGSAGGGISQDVLTLKANPGDSGYLGQSQWPLMQFGLMNLQSNSAGSNINYESATDLFSSPGYVAGSEIAMRFIPNHNENLTKFEINVIEADSTTAQLQVSLRPDNSTCRTGISGTCSHPDNVAHALQTSSVTFSSLNSTFATCPTTTGKCTWANVTFSGSTAELTSGTNYWLVMNATKNSFIGFLRLVSPNKNLVYYSANDYSTWGVPPDGPSDLSYQIQTTSQDFNNTVLGEASINLGQIAQSFSPTSNMQLKGLWIYASTGGISNLNVSIDTDSGSDSPTNTVLASGLISFYSPGESFNYASLNHAINITSGTKYWIVLSANTSVSSGGTPAGYADIFRSDYPGNYGGGSSAYHYKTHSSSGWSNPTQKGSTLFILAGSDTTIKTYSTSQLYTEINNYESESYSGTPILPLQGWNSFLNYYQADIMYNLTQYSLSAFGQSFYWVSGMPIQIPQSIPDFNSTDLLAGTNGASGPIGCDPMNPSCGGDPTAWFDNTQDFINGLLESPSQASTLPLTSLGNEGDNGGDLTSSNDLQYQYSLLPVIDNGATLTYNDWAFGDSGAFKGLDNITVTSAIRNQFGIEMARMANYGGFYGTTKDAVRVLWIGSQSSSGDGFFPEFLTPAINMTISTAEDPNQTAFGNLEQFNVIVGYPSSPTSNFISRYDSFVRNGGGAVDTSLSCCATGNNYVMGYDVESSGVSTSSSLTIETKNAITNPYNSISYTPYWMRHETVPVSNETPVVFVEDSNGNPIITANHYFGGIGVNIEQPWDSGSSSGNAMSFDGEIYGSPRDSFITILTNAIYYAAGKSSMLPIIWEGSYAQQQNWSPYLQYSIDGGPGKPVLLWLANNDTSVSGFNINLNATFFGISTAGWIAIDMQNLSVISSGTGADIQISTKVKAQNWEPIYIMNDTGSSLSPLYETENIIGTTSNTLTLSGNYNSSNWLILKEASSVTSVSSSLTGTFTSYGTLTALNTTKIGYTCGTISSSLCSSWSWNTQEGYYWDSTDGLLYIHFRSGNPATLTIQTSGGKSSTTTLLSCSPNPVQINSLSTCSATISGSSPTGTVSFTTTSSTGSFSASTCTLVSSTCSVTYRDSTGGMWTISGNYSGDSNNHGSAGSFVLTVNSSSPTPGTPDYSNPRTSALVAGGSTKFSLFWSDSAGMSHYIFSWADGGNSFTNGSTQSTSGTTVWTNTTETINSTVGSYIQWRYFGEDANSVWNTSLTYCFVAGSSSSVLPSTYATISDSCYDILAYTGTTVVDLANNPQFQNGIGSQGYHQIAWAPSRSYALVTGYNNVLASYSQSAGITQIATGLGSTTNVNSVSFDPSNSNIAVIATSSGLLLYSSGVISTVSTGSSINFDRVQFDPTGTYAIAFSNTTSVAAYFVAGSGSTSLLSAPAVGLGLDFGYYQSNCAGANTTYAQIVGSGTIFNYYTGNSSFSSPVSFSSIPAPQVLTMSLNKTYSLITEQNLNSYTIFQYHNQILSGVSFPNNNTANQVAFVPNNTYALVTTTGGYLVKISYLSTSGSTITIANDGVDKLRGIAWYSTSAFPNIAAYVIPLQNCSTTTQTGGGGQLPITTTSSTMAISQSNVFAIENYNFSLYPGQSETISLTALNPTGTQIILENITLISPTGMAVLVSKLPITIPSGTSVKIQVQVTADGSSFSVLGVATGSQGNSQIETTFVINIHTNQVSLEEYQTYIIAAILTTGVVGFGVLIYRKVSD